MNIDSVFNDSSLHYTTDDLPGISRRKQGSGFSYYYCDGTQVTEAETLARIKSLAIPPAYNDVWISPIAHGHIQATARDSKNRKQYRYHPLWRSLREENKFQTLIPFGKSLAKIRQHVAQELDKPLKINKTQIICGIIYLLDNYFIRIGNLIYEKQNKSYGLTTLRKKHLSLSASKAELNFIGKNAKPWHVVLRDKKIIKLLKKCEALPGYRLFKYIDDTDNSHCEITSQDINAYLQQLTNYSFTAKDFRTWGACRELLYRFSQVEYQQNALKPILLEVSSLLGHTPAICQKSYIHPELINQWKQKKIIPWLKKRTRLLQDKDKLLLRWLEYYAK